MIGFVFALIFFKAVLSYENSAPLFMFPAGQKGRAVHTSAPARPVGNHKKGEKHMKKASKFLCALLAVVLTVALAVPAFASTADLGQQWQKEASDVLKVTFSNPACGAGDLHWYGRTENAVHVIVVPDGTTMTFNPNYACIRRGWDWDKDGTMYTDMWVPYVPADSEGSEWAYGGKLSTSASFMFGGEYEMRGFALQNKENYVDDEDQPYYDPVKWYAVMSQSTANFLASLPNGDSDGTIFVYRDANGTTQPAKPADPGVKPDPGVSVPLNDGSGEFAYTVKSGDNLKKIAAYYFGDANVYKLIYERNKGTIKNVNMIYAGQTIILPSYAAVAQGVASITSAKPADPGVKPAPGVSVPLNDGSGEFAYTVKSGDTLGRIAAYYYGNVNVYKLIYERNKDTLKSPNAIYAGQTIILPSYAAVAQGVAKI